MWSRLVALLWRVCLVASRRRVDAEARRELETHLELLTDRYRRLGMTAEDAHTAAKRQIGSSLSVRQEIHQMNSIGWLDELWDNVKFAIRQLRGSPGFTAVAAVTLALGIGANSAMFALVDATLLRPLPFPESDRLVMVWERTPRSVRSTVAPLNFHDWNERNRTFEAMAATFYYARRLSAPDGSVEQIPAEQVTPGFFELLGARAIAGRTFLQSDVAVPPNVVALSEGLWRARFGGDPDVVGRIIELDAQPFTVVGVIGGDLQAFTSARLWTVWAELPEMDSRASRFMRVIGRVRPGITAGTAQSDLERVAAELAMEYRATNAETSVTVDLLRDALISSEIESTSLLFLGVVGFVLLMCSVNVANLLLARTAGRERELAVRAALGAGRGRISRQLLTESVALATMGGLLGLVVGGMILRAAPAGIPAGILPGAVVLSFDVRVLVFGIVTAAATGILFGLAPAWQATRTSLVAALVSEGRASRRGGGRLRSLLVIGEVAAAVLLLCGAGLLLRTLAAYGSVDAGHRTSALLTVFPSIDYALPTSMFGSEDELRQFLQDVEREVGSVPGVEHAGWSRTLPLGGFSPVALEVVGEQPASERTRASAHSQIVSPGYFAALGVSLVEGRGFSGRDAAESPPVCIVSESFARQHLGGRNPIGMRLAVPKIGIGPRQSVVREIVGVVADVRLTFDESAESRAVYVPVAQNPWSFLTLLVKPRAGSPQALLPDVRAAVARIDRRVPIAARTLEDYLQLITARPRFRAIMVSTFAALSLALAMVGVFGVLAYSVQQRRREFGVRIALGASRAAVLRLVLGSVGRLIGTGALLGLVLAAVFAQVISTFLFGVRPLDPLTFAGVILVLGATAAIASAIPALRASQVDPVVAFRND